MQQESSLNSQFLANLVKEQSSLESSIKQLNTVDQAFNEQVVQLKATLTNNNNALVELTDPFKSYSYYLNTKLNGLKNNCLTSLEL